LLTNQLRQEEKIMNDISRNRNAGDRFSRRQFIKFTGAAFAGMAFPLSRPNWPWQISDPDEHRPVIIIGSGFGGAITACRLTQAGIPVTLIEKGRRWPIAPDGNTFSRYIYPDGRSTWLRYTTVVPIGPPLPINRYAGVLEGHFFPGLRVLTASCYGGGSIVYGGLLVQPPKLLFEQVFPQEMNYDELEKYYRRVADTIDISVVPDDIFHSEYFTHFRVMEEQCWAAGLKTIRIKSASDWNIVRNEITGMIKPSCIHGEAIYGVNSGAKRSLDMNYLLQAENTGMLEVKTLNRVKDIGIDNDYRYLVKVQEIDLLGNVTNEIVYSCDYLFLAAGSMGTSNLLVKAKAKCFLPDLNNHIGKGWGNNGNVEVMRSCLNVRTGQWQGGPPASAIEDYDNPIAPIFIEHPQFPLGFESYSLLYFGIGTNPTHGQFHYNYFTDTGCLSWPKQENQQQRITQALLHTATKLNEANGGVINKLFWGTKGYLDNAVYHPLGGAVLGKACDYFGRVKNYNRLYVNDSALIPGSTASANPAFTVAAIAERNIEKIITEDF
jgi:cholesterol oxidase